MNFDPFCWIIVGAPGTGKTSQIRIELAQRAAPRRVIVDPMHTIGREGGHVTPLAKLPAALAAPGPFSIVVQPNRASFKHMRAAFGFVCREIIKVQQAKASAPLLLIIDELADVTHPNPYEVPESWAMVMRDQRHFKMHVIACTQRPAEIDKRIWSFSTRIRAGRLNSSADVRGVADVLMVHHTEVAGLIGTQWIERDKTSGETKRGTLEWRNRKPSNVERRIVAPNSLPARTETRDKKIGASRKPSNVRGRMSR